MATSAAVRVARVEHLFKEAAHSGQRLLLSAVNWGKVVYRVWLERGETRARQTAIAMSKLPIDVSPVLPDDAFDAARLKAVHKLPYADSLAAALALREHAALVTSDPDSVRLGKQLSILWLR